MDRLKLHKKLTNILGSNEVYFQPPNKLKINYPCIIYERIRYSTSYADGVKYRSNAEYKITLIYKDPDSDIPLKVLKELDYCRSERSFKQDNLIHDIYNLYTSVK